MLKKTLYAVLAMLLLAAALATAFYALGYYNFKSLTVSNLLFEGKIALVPLAGVDESSWEVRLIKSQIEDTYGFEVDVLYRQEMPERAFYSPNGLYRASQVLSHLAAAMPDGYDKVIGVTDSGIFTTTDVVYDRAVIGLSQQGREACVVSTYWLKVKKITGGQYERRLSKSSLHELGHTLGLPHCDNTPSCFMTDARGQAETIDSEDIALCGSCKRLISFTQR